MSPAQGAPCSSTKFHQGSQSPEELSPCEALFPGLPPYLHSGGGTSKAGEEKQPEALKGCSSSPCQGTDSAGRKGAAQRQKQMMELALKSGESSKTQAHTALPF